MFDVNLFKKLRRISDRKKRDEYIREQFAHFLKEEGMVEWEIAKKWHIWKCFWCDHAEGRSFVRCYDIKCTVKGRFFKEKYKCKTHFVLRVDQKRSILFMEMWGRGHI